MKSFPALTPKKIKEALDEAQVTLKQLKQTYELKRAASVSTIRIQEIQRDPRSGSHALRAGKRRKNGRALSDGRRRRLHTIWLGGEWELCSRAMQVRPGVPFLQVGRSLAMEVRVELNQVDVLKVHPGQRAQMRLDAYPEWTLPAVLEEFSPLGQHGTIHGSRQIIAARFSVQGTDPRLLPDLSAALDLDLGTKNVLVVPWQSIGTEADHPFVWLKTTGSFSKRNRAKGSSKRSRSRRGFGLKEGDIIRRSAVEDEAGAGLQ